MSVIILKRAVSARCACSLEDRFGGPSAGLSMKREEKRRIKMSFYENNSDHPHPPIFAKNMPQKYAIQWESVWHKSRLNSRNFYRKYGIRTPLLYGIRIPPFMPYEPFLLGGGGGL